MRNIKKPELSLAVELRFRMIELSCEDILTVSCRESGCRAADIKAIGPIAYLSFICLPY